MKNSNYNEMRYGLQTLGFALRNCLGQFFEVKKMREKKKTVLDVPGIDLIIPEYDLSNLSELELTEAERKFLEKFEEENDKLLSEIEDEM